MTFIYFILLLSAIVVVHELGHLLTAKMFNVYCYEFSIGMGPKLISKKTKETEYSIRALPIGGFVAMAGEDNNYKDVKVPYERTIKGIKKWKQIIIMLAGVFMNFVFALLISSMIYLRAGYYVESAKPVVDSVVKNSVAEASGFLKGDLIEKVILSDGTTIKPKSFNDILPFTQSESNEITYIVKRNDERIEIKVTPQYDKERNEYLIGIGIPKPEIKKVTILNSFKYGAKQLVSISRIMFIAIVRLFSGKGLEQLSGPVGIYQTTKETVALGFESFMMLIAIFSLNVGIFNLLPVPVLDGGRALITFFEMIFKRDINKKIETAIMIIGWILMIGLMLLATWQDISRLF